MTEDDAQKLWFAIDHRARMVGHNTQCPPGNCSHAQGTPTVYGYEALSKLVIETLCRLDASPKP